MNVLTPPAVIGIVGGGQLGRMLALVARRCGYRVAVLTGGGRDTPAGVLADWEMAAAFDDAKAMRALVDRSDVITWELEDADLAVTRVAADAGVPVRPGRRVMATAADRWAEKRAFIAAGVPVAPYREASSPPELAAAVASFDTPVVVKTARSGYDGKGQVRIAAGEAGRCRTSAELFESLGSRRLIVEQEVPFDREVSVVVARGGDGTVADHGVMENVHVDRILDTTVTPAHLPPEVAGRARSVAARLAVHLDLVGVLCVEMFLVGSELVVNEMAPRPHNSGHCTVEAAAVSQFEQQLRAVCGLPLGDGACRPAAMAQLLGDLWEDGEPLWAEAFTHLGVQLHLYGKSEVRPGRKMGHLTCVDTAPATALQQVLAARDGLRP